MTDPMTDKAAAEAFFVNFGFTGHRAEGRFGLPSRPLAPDKCACAKFGHSNHVQCWNPPKVTDAAGRGWCGVHSPAAVAKRAARAAERDRQTRMAWEARRRREAREASIRAAKDAALVAIRKIAEGHNDPRALASEVMDLLPKDIA